MSKPLFYVLRTQERRFATAAADHVAAATGRRVAVVGRGPGHDSLFAFAMRLLRTHGDDSISSFLQAKLKDDHGEGKEKIAQSKFALFFLNPSLLFFLFFSSSSFVPSSCQCCVGE